MNGKTKKIFLSFSGLVKSIKGGVFMNFLSEKSFTVLSQTNLHDILYDESLIESQNMGSVPFKLEVKKTNKRRKK